MEERLKIAILNPAGNVTAIVLSEISPQRRAALAERLLSLPELHIEQAAFLAPTEVLARQHFANISRYLAPTGVRCALLTGSTSAKERRCIAKGSNSSRCAARAIFRRCAALSRANAALWRKSAVRPASCR